MGQKENYTTENKCRTYHNVSKAQLKIEFFFHQTGTQWEPNHLKQNELPNHFKWEWMPEKTVVQIGSFPQIRTTPPSRCRITGISFWGGFPSSWNGSFDMLQNIFANKFHSSTHGDSNF